MKVFFFLNRYIEGISILEMALELMAKHVDCGDDVYFIACDGALFGYCKNYFGINKERCILCRNYFYKQLNRLSIPKKNIKIFKKKEFKKFKFPNFDDLDQLMNFNLNDIDFGNAVASSLISTVRDHKLDVRLYSNKINDMLNFSINIYNIVFNFLKKIKPDFCYICNGRGSLYQPVLRVSQKLKIPFYTYDMCRKKWSYFLLKNRRIHNLNVIKEIIKQSWQNGLESDKEKEKIGSNWLKNWRGGEKGWKVFTDNQIRGVLPKNFDFKKKNIVIFNSSLDEFEAFPEWKSFIYDNEHNILKKIFSNLLKDEKFFFYLRVHPNLKGLNNTQIKELKKLESLNFKNLKIIWAEEEVDSYTLLNACEKVITFGSTLGLEACFWGKPSILIGRGYYEDLNCCYMPKSQDEIINLIRSDLFPKPKLGALMYGYWKEKQAIPIKRFVPEYTDDKNYWKNKIIPNLKFKDKIAIRFWWRIENLKKFKSNIFK